MIICLKLICYFKGLYHGWLVHFVYNGNYTSLYVMKLVKLLGMLKSHLRVKQMHFSNLANNKYEL